MMLTLESLFNDSNIIKAVIDRVVALGLDEIYWKRYMDFEQTMSRTFKTYAGSVTGVYAGSVIDKDSNKPIRQRRSMGSGVGEIAYLGDRYQIDNHRLDTLKSLIDKFNVAKTTDQSQALNEIINYIIDDMRQCLLAPHKRMDLVLGELRSTGKASVKLADNPEGIEVLEMSLPFKFLTPGTEAKAKFISYLKEEVEKAKSTIGRFVVMEMSRSTFNKNIVGCAEFGTNYKMVFGNAELASSGGLMTNAMANQLFEGIGLPAIRIVDDYVALAKGGAQATFADNRISLLPSEKIGKMMWHQPYEISDPITGKTYSRHEGGMYISQVRNDEGRFMEYGCEWMPNITVPNSILNIDLSTMNG